MAWFHIALGVKMTDSPPLYVYPGAISGIKEDLQELSKRVDNLFNIANKAVDQRDLLLESNAALKEEIRQLKGTVEMLRNRDK